MAIVAEGLSPNIEEGVAPSLVPESADGAFFNPEQTKNIGHVAANTNNEFEVFNRHRYGFDLSQYSSLVSEKQVKRLGFEGSVPAIIEIYDQKLLPPSCKYADPDQPAPTRGPLLEFPILIFNQNWLQQAQVRPDFPVGLLLSRLPTAKERVLPAGTLIADRVQPLGSKQLLGGEVDYPLLGTGRALDLWVWTRHRRGVHLEITRHLPPEAGSIKIRLGEKRNSKSRAA